MWVYKKNINVWSIFDWSEQNKQTATKIIERRTHKQKQNKTNKTNKWFGNDRGAAISRKQNKNSKGGNKQKIKCKDVIWMG